MNVDAVISWLLRCDWFFLAAWIAALAVATAAELCPHSRRFSLRACFVALCACFFVEKRLLEPRKSSEMNSPFRA